MPRQTLSHKRPWLWASRPRPKTLASRARPRSNIAGSWLLSSQEELGLQIFNIVYDDILSKTWFEYLVTLKTVCLAWFAWNWQLAFSSSSTISTFLILNRRIRYSKLNFACSNCDLHLKFAGRYDVKLKHDLELLQTWVRYFTTYFLLLLALSRGYM